MDWRSLLAIVCMSVVGLSTVLALTAPFILLRFRQRREPTAPKRWPSVSVLKPVKGLDPAAAEGFQSFIDQDYPGTFEVIFAVEGYEDPVLPLIHRLCETHPERVRLVHSSARADVMGKANNVMAAYAAATGEILISADSDIIAAPDHTRRLVAALLERKNIGAVGVLPIYRQMGDLGSSLMGAYYSPFMTLFYATKAVLGPRDVFPGTYYAIRREALEAVGGFARVADNIADDTTMGQYLFKQGWESVLSLVSASVPEPTKRLEEFRQHQHRWQLTYRATLPLGLYLAQPLTHPIVFALLLPFVAGGVGLFSLGIYLGVRYALLAWINATVLHEPALWRAMWFLPLTEFFLTEAWLRAIIDPTTVWRGLRYRVAHGGKLVRLHDKNDQHSAPDA